MMTLIEHWDLGTQLRFMQKQAAEIHGQLEAAYGEHRAVVTATHLSETIRTLRDMLDGQLCRDHPADASVTIYGTDSR